MNRRTVLVTGASRGIGRAIALKFAQEGYHLVITCIHSQDLLEQTQKDIQALGAECLAFCGDMGDMADCQKLFDLMAQQGTHIDVLVNNAGIAHLGLLQDMTSQQWDELLRTNLTSVFNCCKLAIPHMLHQKQGKIINISSVWGLVGASCEVAYSATKGAINSLTSALAKELAPSHIQVNAIACGAIDTDMNRWMSAEERDSLQEEIPAGRLGTPDEVAHLAFQLTDQNQYLTGQIIKLDGGWI